MKKDAALIYLENQIKTAGPAERMRMILDVALRGCRQRDAERASRAIGVLLESLDLKAEPETARVFLRLYAYCDEQARQGNFEEAALHLGALRDAWSQAGQNPTQKPEASSLKPEN